MRSTELFGARKKCAPPTPLRDADHGRRVGGTGTDVKPGTGRAAKYGRQAGHGRQARDGHEAGHDSGPDTKTDGPVTCMQDARDSADNGKDDNCNGLIDCKDPAASATGLHEGGRRGVQQQPRRR
jgi:hypothetical protein